MLCTHAALDCPWSVQQSKEKALRVNESPGIEHRQGAVTFEPENEQEAALVAGMSQLIGKAKGRLELSLVNKWFVSNPVDEDCGAAS